MKTITLLLILALSALAQVQEVGEVTLESIDYSSANPVYPTLARQARASGPVRVALILEKSEDLNKLTDMYIRLVSGHPLLNHVVWESVMKWKFKSAVAGRVEVEYLFTTIPSEMIEDFHEVPRGGSVKIFLLKKFGKPTHTTVKTAICSPATPMAQQEKPEVIQEKPLKLRIRVVAPDPCIQTASAVTD